MNSNKLDDFEAMGSALDNDALLEIIKNHGIKIAEMQEHLMGFVAQRPWTVGSADPEYLAILNPLIDLISAKVALCALVIRRCQGCNNSS